MGRREVAAAVEDLLGDRGRFSSSDLARATGLTRQALHRHLTNWVDEGLLVREGKARATRYRRATKPGGTGGDGGSGIGRSYRVAGLAADAPWRDLAVWLDHCAPDLAEGAREVLKYVTRELVDNVVRHSGSESLDVRAYLGEAEVALSVRDEGLGLFEHIREKHGLAKPLDAFRELAVAQAAPRHRAPVGEREGGPGRGLFLIARLVSLLELDANGLEWAYDTGLDEQVLTQVPPRPGSEVRISVARGATTSVAEVEARWISSEDEVPSKTLIRLAEHGGRCVTRSDARELARGFARCNELELDFEGVEGIGLGFADELFRVWSRAHADTRVSPSNTNPAVALMIESVLRP